MEFISKVKNELKRTNFVNDAFVFLEKNYISMMIYFLKLQIFFSK